jgi:hypothetical protein
LNRIGLTEDNNPDVVQSFVDIRNNAVHPIVSNIDLDERKKTIVKAIQWIDEIILWRIGYSGQYSTSGSYEVQSNLRKSVSEQVENKKVYFMTAGSAVSRSHSSNGKFDKSKI